MNLRFLFALLTVVVLTACNAPTPAPTATPSPIPVPTATQPPPPTVVPSPTPIPRKTIWVDPVLPTDVHDTLVKEMTAFAQGASDPTFVVEVTTTQQADVRVTVGDEGVPLITRTTLSPRHSPQSPMA